MAENPSRRGSEVSKREGVPGGSKSSGKKRGQTRDGQAPFQDSGNARGRSERYGEARQPRESGVRREGRREAPFQDSGNARGRSERYGEARQPRESGVRREAPRSAKPGSGVPKSRLIRAQKSWGALSRKGAVKAIDYRESREIKQDRLPRTEVRPEPFFPERFEQVEEEASSSKTSSVRSRKAQARTRTAEALLEKEVSRPLTQANKTKAQRLFASAVDAYDRDRYVDAKRMLEQVISIASDSLSVMELYGLTLYRMGQWAAAVKVLDEFSTRSGSFDQYPVLADCYRAQKRYKDVDRIWSELSAVSPAADVMGEGRIVIASAAADQGNLSKAISILERSLSIRRTPTFVDLRQWYVLADLYERAGEISHARSLFNRIINHDANFFDVAERLSDLG